MSTKKRASGGEFCTATGSEISEADVATPLGVYTIRACNKGIHFLSTKDVTDENFDPNTDTVVESQSKGIAPKSLKQGMDWLSTYFENPRGITHNIPPVCLPPSESTEFERKVWKTLAKMVLFGSSCSYAELADLIENPKAARATGTALKKNPIALIIPCHRVIRSNGTAGNYSGGKRNKIKEWLLEYERQK